MIKKLLAGTSCFMWLSACVPMQAASLYLKADDHPDPHCAYRRNNIASFFLPKNLLQVAVTYSVFVRDESAAGGKITIYPCVMQSPKISLTSAADNDLQFYVYLDHLNDWLTDSTLTGLTIGDDLVLKGVNTTFDDRTAAILENIASTAINIGKMAAMGAGNAQLKYVGDVTVYKTVDPDSEIVQTSLTAASSDKTSSQASNTSESEQSEKVSKNLGLLPSMAAPKPVDKSVASSGDTYMPTLTAETQATVTPSIATKNIVWSSLGLPAPNIGSIAPGTVCREISLRSIDQHAFSETSIFDQTDVIAITNLLSQKKVTSSVVPEVFFPQKVSVILPQYENPLKGQPNVTDATHPYLTFSAPPLNIHDLLDEPLVQHLPASKRFKGIIARAPKVVPVFVAIEQTQNFDRQAGLVIPATRKILGYASQIPIAQAGTFSRYPVHKKFFSSVSKNVQLSNSGSPTTIGATHTSPLERITGMLANITQNLTSLGGSGAAKK